VDIMTNPYEDQDEARRRYLVDTFGDNVTVGLAADQPAARRRTADRVAAAPLAAARETQQARDLEEIAAIAEEEREDEALTAAIRRYRRGDSIPTGTMTLVRRALERHGYSHGTAAERLAAMAGQHQEGS
jgi:hypothetical protein